MLRQHRLPCNQRARVLQSLGMGSKRKGTEMEPSPATVQILATLAVPDGRFAGSSHAERHVVRACPACAGTILSRYARIWDWGEMDVDAQHGNFGTCDHYNA